MFEVFTEQDLILFLELSVAIVTFIYLVGRACISCYLSGETEEDLFSFKSLLRRNNFRNNDKYFMLVSLGGPIFIFVTALLIVILFKILFVTGACDVMRESVLGSGMLYLLALIVACSVLVLVYSIIPIPPLPGSRILRCFLNDKAKEIMDKYEKGMFWLIFVLLLYLPYDYTVKPIMKVISCLLEWITKV